MRLGDQGGMVRSEHPATPTSGAVFSWKAPRLVAAAVYVVLISAIALMPSCSEQDRRQGALSRLESTLAQGLGGSGPEILSVWVEHTSGVGLVPSTGDIIGSPEFMFAEVSDVQFVDAQGRDVDSAREATWVALTDSDDDPRFLRGILLQTGEIVGVGLLLDGVDVVALNLDDDTVVEAVVGSVDWMATDIALVGKDLDLADLDVCAQARHLDIGSIDLERDLTAVSLTLECD